MKRRELSLARLRIAITACESRLRASVKRAAYSSTVLAWKPVINLINTET